MTTPSIHTSHQRARAKPYAGLVAQAPGYVEGRVEMTCRNRGRRGFPLAGPSGWNFESYLHYLKPARTRWQYYIDNVYDRRIVNDDLSTLCQKKPAEEDGFADERTRLIMNKKVPGGKGYLQKEGWQQLSRLFHNIDEQDPPILIALGAFATFALTGRDLPLSDHRGVLIESHLKDSAGKPRLLIPSYHPSPRNQLNAPLLMFDLIKADNFVKGIVPVRRKPRYVLIPETPGEVQSFFIKNQFARAASCDIETTKGRGFIKSIQVAFNDEEGICVFFYTRSKGPYWDSEDDHLAALQACKSFLENDTPKIFHKGAFDTEWLWQSYRIAVRNFRHDTSIRSHSVFTELPRDLGTLGANFDHEIAWKALAGAQDAEKDE